ncbi:bifunctional 4-hydroxy-2-oxoglutarate aldolase/2-dehydro-3-deoxy-phosphogluconate aldolase [Treponema sp. OMZ 840]|uniref:bifunctional 4-hydroxy-2-oxoglutarate aldolase/2-dehydro-3-deoxy-phosphogluconate aldolase n=1 Tax=Treponema sp. OMZ 840 TaxID=244313 RepID=UPI003D8EDC2D
MTIYEKIESHRLVPVVALNNVSDALNLADALIAGGLPVAEITFRTSAAEESIRIISKERPDMLVGAGTVTKIEQVAAAADAGAKFIVTPGFSKKITEAAIKQGLPVFPGVCTPTEIMQTLEYDLPVLKFFPASQYGGLKTIKALNGPFPNIRFMPTGGINKDNLAEYLNYSGVTACGGSWMVGSKLIGEGKFGEITQLTKEAVELIAGLSKN